jgi:hypothetical protein
MAPAAPASTVIMPALFSSADLAYAGGSWALAYAIGDNRSLPAHGASAPVQAPGQSLAVPSFAGGAAGFGFSIFITLAVLLVLGAPWTRRRLRSAGRPRWPAPFVLIPDRPG